jgi:ABC-type nitrate/sulfonate/bicarbonate transport system substrate-binding protein
MRINVLCLGAVGLCSTLLTVAQRQGFFKRHGVEIRLVRVPGTEIPEPSSNNPIAYIGAPAALMRASGGIDLKVIACFDSARLSSCLVVNADISAPEQLRGKRLGARAEGAAIWIHTVLALEQLGLKPARDQISIAEIGDPLDIVEALEAGQIVGAVLSRPQCEQLTTRGYSILVDLFPCNVYGAPDAVVATTTFLLEHPDVVESIVAGLIEGAAFTLSPRQRLVALEAIKAELMITDGGAAESGLLELLNTVVRKPYPSVERLCDMQRVMSAGKPDVLRVSIKELVHDRVVRKLDQDGFIDRIYAAYGVT